MSASHTGARILHVPSPRSLLLHELGHARQARREGMEIEGITLWLFGGVAQFKGAFPSAGRSDSRRRRGQIDSVSSAALRG